MLAPRAIFAEYRTLKRQRGFALVITITLLAFLVLVMVGLATFTRVESTVSANSSQQTQAKQNALMALKIALSQLQRHAGPDTRVTATAEGFGGVDGTKYYTGVWDSSTTGAAPVTWLVSGNESNATAISPASAPSPDYVELVGTNTAGSSAASRVSVLKQKIFGDLPGVGPQQIGSYAWWVGDQGVKADVATTNRVNTITYAPYTSEELRRRIKQQVGLGANAVDANGAVLFEPHDTINSALVSKITTSTQLALLQNSTGAASVGTAVVTDNYHNLSAYNRAVLANTVAGGLKKDLSLNPALLGAEFASWVDYTSTSSMEQIGSPETPNPLPAYGTDPLRRRYKITPPVAGSKQGIAPVLTYFYLTFGVRKQNAASPYVLSLRWAAAMWNPYTSALIPEGLRLEVTGLPTAITIKAHSSGSPAGSGSPVATIPFESLYGSTLKLKLPWDLSATQSDKRSWLPGRTYNWVSTEDPDFNSGSTNLGRFYSRDIPGFDKGILKSLDGTTTVNGASRLSLSIGTSTTLTVKVLRESDGALIATFTSPRYQEFSTTNEFDANDKTSAIGFIFRLAESYDTIALDPNIWLSTEGQDPRSGDYPASGLTTSPKSTNPADCFNYTKISAPDRFFDRDITRGTSYNEDVPLFELPRSPILSLGEIQHYYIAGARPFSVGNSWGNNVLISNVRGNEIFDRFFVSGLQGSVAPDISQRQPMPNPLMQMLALKTDATAVAIADLKNAPAQMSSKYLMQSGSFNLNSTNVAAWIGILLSSRLMASDTFNYLNLAANSGTAADTSISTSAQKGALFYRFAQSAQETFRADDNYAQTKTDVEDRDDIVLNVPLYRRGLRSLDVEKIRRFSAAIVDLQKVRQARFGPFRSIEEFLNPVGGVDEFKSTSGSGVTMSLLEKAIEVADLNGKTALGLSATDPEFSSQWLTQGDIMTALAPLLFPRSDTFIIRTYGDSINSATGARESAAWCEALVQRLPEPYAPALANNPTDAEYQTPPGVLGRRFKVITVRWLTNSDI